MCIPTVRCKEHLIKGLSTQTEAASRESNKVHSRTSRIVTVATIHTPRPEGTRRESTTRTQRGHCVKWDTKRTCGLCWSHNQPVAMKQGGSGGNTPNSFSPTLCSSSVPLVAKPNRKLEAKEPITADPTVSLPEHEAD